MPDPSRGQDLPRVHARDVCTGLLAAGARAGDTLFYHGSLSSMGWVEGGAAAVVAGALEAVAPGGTVAAPALWYRRCDPPLNPADFNPETSPTYVGALAEGLRRDPRSLRSRDFSHAVSARGARAAELTAEHGDGRAYPSPWSPGAFAESSPWSRLYAWDALYVFIGVDMRVCTMKHYIESRLVAGYLEQALPGRRAALTERLKRIGHDGVWPFYPSGRMGEVLEEAGYVTRARIGAATVLAIRTRPLVIETLRRLRETPESWFPEPFLAWRAETLRDASLIRK